jgi:hypothetical protein
VVRAVATDDALDQQKTTHPVALLAEAVAVAIRAAYRVVRRWPQRAPGFVVGVIDERPALGGVVHSEPVPRESGIAEKMSDLCARVEAGELP